MARTQVPAADLDNIYQSKGYSIGLEGKVAGDPADLSGFTFRSQLRRYPSSVDVAAEFIVDMTNAATGRVVLALTSQQTSALSPGPYFWDVDLLDNGVPVPISKAQIIVEAEVTR